jgi:hypothetical protein
MTNLGRKIEIFIIVAVIALVGIVYAFKKPALAPTTNNANISQNDNQQQVPSSVIEYKGEDGKNALELLKATHRVDAQHYSFGDLVTGIDGIAPDPNHFWAMYVNGEFSQVGASAYVTKNSDTIRWQIDEVKN